MKEFFPIFRHHPDLIYLDSAASAQKPQCVLDALHEFSSTSYANIHRGRYSLSLNATEAYEKSRQAIADFFGVFSKEIVFTKNGTEAANLFIRGYATEFLKEGDEVLLPLSEHHANVVPWLQMRKEKGIVLTFIEPDEKGVFTVEDFKKQISPKTRVLACGHVSNVTGQIFPLQELSEIAHQNNAILFVDACQSAPHFPVSFLDLGADATFFTGHKLGAGGTGGLWCKGEILERLPPLLLGGDSISEVTRDGYTLLPPPERFESGTPAIENIVGLGKAVEFVETKNFLSLRDHEISLLSFLQAELQNIPDICIIGPQNINDRSGLISFYHKKVHHADIAEYLAENNICVRSGFHCANPLHQFLGLPGTVRASVWMYNTKDDIKRFVEVLREAIILFNR